MGTPDPWAELANRPHIDLVWSDLPVGVLGLSDGHSTIWLDRNLSQRERRSVLAHELAHVHRGDRGRQPPTVEAKVRADVARWLLPDLVEVGRVLAAAPSLDEAARDLWVTEDVLEDRLAGLDDSERQALTQDHAEALCLP